MKLEFKKYIYFINDITSLILKKDQLQAQEQAHKLRIAVIILCLALLISIVLNVWLLLNWLD